MSSSPVAVEAIEAVEAVEAVEAIEDMDSDSPREKRDWKKNEYVKMATEITNDMVGMVKHSQLTEKMGNGMKKLKKKIVLTLIIFLLWMICLRIQM